MQMYLRTHKKLKEVLVTMAKKFPPKEDRQEKMDER